MNRNDGIVFNEYEISTFILIEDQLKVVQTVNDD